MQREPRRCGQAPYATWDEPALSSGRSPSAPPGASADQTFDIALDGTLDDPSLNLHLLKYVFVGSSNTGYRAEDL